MSLYVARQIKFANLFQIVKSAYTRAVIAFILRNGNTPLYTFCETNT